mmetsp:Transcript_21652/g.52295  ORF Transcript_21652/g.52295 Transcript_21652/m.52295 type:complete len:243 (-) Transcript_21652:214-942(-)
MKGSELGELVRISRAALHRNSETVPRGVVFLLADDARQFLMIFDALSGLVVLPGCHAEPVRVRQEETGHFRLGRIFPVSIGVFDAIELLLRIIIDYFASVNALLKLLCDRCANFKPLAFVVCGLSRIATIVTTIFRIHQRCKSIRDHLQLLRIHTLHFGSEDFATSPHLRMRALEGLLHALHQHTDFILLEERRRQHFHVFDHGVDAFENLARVLPLGCLLGLIHQRLKYPFAFGKLPLFLS